MPETATTHPLTATSLIFRAVELFRERVAGTETVEFPDEVQRNVPRATGNGRSITMGYTAAVCVTAPDRTRWAFAAGSLRSTGTDVIHDHDLIMIAVQTPVGAPAEQLADEITQILTDPRGLPDLLRACVDNRLLFDTAHPQRLNLSAMALDAVRAEQVDLGGHNYRYTHTAAEIVFAGLCRLLAITPR